MSLTDSTPSSDIVFTTDNPPFDWLTVSPAEAKFFSNDRRTQLRFYTASSGNHVSTRVGSAYIYRGRTQGIASQGSITDGNELVPTHSNIQSLETRGGMGLKQYSIVDESFVKVQSAGVHRISEFVVKPNEGWKVSVSNTGDSMTFTPSSDNGTFQLIDSARETHPNRALVQLVFERSGWPGYGSNLEPQSHPTMDNFDAVESGCLYYIWRDLGNDDTRTGTFSPDRYYAQGALGR
ncbi:hypothetical protein L486_04595 [Kwoniella mangroviensis CBS 10435]|uniref:Uncharacterized protein n=1 Tax=Kwoniella mangroviensis CBS 10435 TaxID=1331196 RepID=A0A1B9ISP3_9TREE|nr:hypothetical protein L486_04595 [Kwoniella mangroviensis CBS 10435]